jgi:hypothetical protein
MAARRKLPVADPDLFRRVDPGESLRSIAASYDVDHTSLRRYPAASPAGSSASQLSSWSSASAASSARRRQTSDAGHRRRCTEVTLQDAGRLLTTRTSKTPLQAFAGASWSALAARNSVCLPNKPRRRAQHGFSTGLKRRFFRIRSLEREAGPRVRANRLSAAPGAMEG